MERTRFIFFFILSFMICLQQSATADNSDDLTKRIKEYFELCPYTDTCFTNVTKPDEILSGVSTSCCSPCSCDTGCGLNCCPDISVEFGGEEELYTAKEIHSCVDAQYRSYDTRIANGPSFEMVSRCPWEYQDNETAAKCARDYSDVSFDVPLRYILPAYDNTTNTIYKNINCAKCHGADLDSLSFGRINFECKVGIRNITYIRDLTSTPEDDNEDGCNILYGITSNTEWRLTALKTCDRRFVDRCNVTGNWESYDRHLEEACLSYKSVYRNFKNVHCLLCNGLNKTVISSICPNIFDSTYMYYDYEFISYSGKKTFNFLTLLNWNLQEEPALLGNIPKPHSHDLCFENILLDPSRADEWLLQCPYGMVKNGEMCVLPFGNMSSNLIIEINLNLEPYEVIQKNNHITLQKMISIVLDEIYLNMALLVTRDVELHNVKGSLKLKSSDVGEANLKMNVFPLKSLEHAQVQIQIIVYNMQQDLFGTVIDFVLGFTNLSKVGEIFKASFHKSDSPFLDPGSLMSNCSNITNRPLFQLCTEKPSSEDLDVNFEVFGIQEKPAKNNFDILLILEPEPFCARIALPKLSVVTCSVSEHITNLYTNDFLSKRLTENSTHIFFCHADYFQQLTSLQTEQVTVHQEQVPVVNVRIVTVLSILCLSISLISLVLTLAIYSIYPALRSLPGLNNMALVTSLIVFQAMSFVSTVLRISISWLCSLFGAITHFSLTFSFAWMFVCTFHMLKVFVKIRNRSVERNSNQTFVSYVFITTGISLLVVAITIAVGAIQSSGKTVGYGGASCYINDPVMIISFVAVPVAIVIIVNIFMFCVVVYNIHRHPTLASTKSKERQNIAIFVKLSTLTGMTWIFGFIYIFTQLEMFAYIFVVLNAGQGVFIMLSFVCNQRVLQMVCKQKFRRNVTKQTSSTEL